MQKAFYNMTFKQKVAEAVNKFRSRRQLTL